jgi:predicted RNase H-like HicB family nuclease
MINALTAETVTEYEFGAPTEGTGDELGVGGMRAVVGLAIFDGEQWASLCPELDIASRGDSSDDALDNLISAVQEAQEVAMAQGLVLGSRIPEADLKAFLELRRSNTVVGRAFLARADATPDR